MLRKHSKAALALGVLFALGTAPAFAASNLSVQISDVSSHYFDYGTNVTLWSCWRLQPKTARKPLLQAKPAGTWLTVGIGSISRRNKTCLAQHPSYPDLVRYSWKIDEMGSGVSGTMHSRLQMREMIGGTTNLFTLPVYPSGYFPDYGRAMECALKQSINGGADLPPGYCKQD